MSDYQSYRKSEQARTNHHMNTAKPGDSYCYSINATNGVKYVGMTNNLTQRMEQHNNGTGSKVTQQNKPVSINHIQKCKSTESAKQAERIVYNNMKAYHGPKVKGAGNTSRFK